MNAELQELVAACEAESDHQSAAAIARRAAVLALRVAGGLRTAAEQFAAGTVLIYSDSMAELAVAEALALAAMGKEPRARQLAATAYDRQRMLRGEAQKFGTQLIEKDGRLELWPIDPTTTDSERAKWGLPALAEIQRRLTARSSFDPGSG